MPKIGDSVKDLLKYLHNHVEQLNNSKIFAGCMIIILNIASRFVNIKLSKSMESYLKFTFSRQILVFAMAWMGTRDIYIALIMTAIFTVLFYYLLNEESSFCCLPESFKDHHINLMDNEISEEDVKKAKEVLDKYKKQTNEKDTNENMVENYSTMATRM